ncbi:nucleotide disphospho-sugar-binding domain-containing protein [Micromonospora sp. NPDC047134]|uniref:nucleotide disphospho-sugar-binding domain-containing protein n=1 Tax=Micromonospora sp. NPDC047134 TaxID=3154340 RepID=UPI0033C2F87D
MGERRLLYALWDGGGNVATTLLMLRSLAAEGTPVTVLSNDSVAERVRAAGLEFTPFRLGPRHDPRSRDTDVLKLWEAGSPAEASRLIRERVMFGPAVELARDTLRAAEECDAQLLAADYTLFGSLVAAERLGLPHVVLMNTIYPLPTVEVAGLRAARNGPFTYLFTRMLAQGLPRLNEARAVFDLPPLTTAQQQYEHADAVVITCYPSFDPASSSVPSKVRYIGPQVEPPAELPEPPGGPVRRVIVSLSTTAQPEEALLVDSLVQAAALVENTEFEFLGGSLADRTDLPANVRGYGYIPLEERLPHADLVLHHGGFGTTMRSLLWGAPAIIFPSFQEQFNSARRLEELGAGCGVRRDSAPEVIAEAISGSLSSAERRSAARECARTFRKEHDPRAAARIFAALAAD